MKKFILFALLFSTSVIYADDIQYEMTELEGGDNFYINPFDLNDKGQILGDGKKEASSFSVLTTIANTARVSTDFGLLREGEQHTVSVHRINNAGQIVGTAYSNKTEISRGILSENTYEGRKIIDLGVDVKPDDINNSGQIVYTKSGSAFLSSMTGEGRVEVELDPVFNDDRRSTDLDLNDLGQVVGVRNGVAYLSSDTGEGRTTVELTPEIEVDYLYEFSSVDINNQGQILLTISEEHPRRIDLKGETFISYETENGREWRRIEELSGYSVRSPHGGLNDSGDFVGYIFRDGDEDSSQIWSLFKFFVYKNNKLYFFEDIISNFSDWLRMHGVRGINNKGQIIGSAYRNENNGQSQSRIVSPGPGPGVLRGVIITPKLIPPAPPVFTDSVSPTEPVNGKWIKERKNNAGAPSKYKPKF